MDESGARTVAAALGGEPWHSGGNIWLVLLRRSDGKLVVISDEAVCEYSGSEEFDAGQEAKTIVLH
jgi:hypothetical protein